ncbi:MAG: ABC transporter permease subunit [Clostridiales bacterium]|jgi:putative aldouronate transport system permease protein|nr:ABC transporter permease subunit [Clostridiales bacterium]
MTSRSIHAAEKTERPPWRRRFWTAFQKYKFFYLLLFPVLLWYAIFCYGPMYGIVTAFQNYSMTKGIMGSPFVGLEHFQKLFQDNLFWRAFRNTVILALYRILIEFPIPILLSLLVNELRRAWMRKVAQTITYLPHFLSWVIIASIIITFINPDTGFIAAIARNFSLSLPPNLITQGSFRWILVITNIWKEAGWGMIIYLASMAGVDSTLYEAAYADGASRFRRAWHVTLPALSNVIAIQMILLVGNVMRTGFDQVFNLSNKLVMATGDVIDFYVYRTVTQDYKLSYGAAMGLFNSVVCMALLLLANYTAKKLNGESIY